MGISRNVYCYLNKEDGEALFRYIFDLGAVICTSRGDWLGAENYDGSFSLKTYYVVAPDSPKLPPPAHSSELTIETSSYLYGMPHKVVCNGIIGLYLKEDDDNEFFIRIFKQVKKYVQKSYVRSDGRYAYYAGPSIYEEWRREKIVLADLIKRREIEVKEADFSLVDFVEEMKRQGYFVTQNLCRMRDLCDELNLSGDCFLVYYDKTKLLCGRRGSTIDFMQGSKCVFFYRGTRKKVPYFVFHIDVREDEKDTPLKKLQDAVEQYLTKILEESKAKEGLLTNENQQL